MTEQGVTASHFIGVRICRHAFPFSRRISPEACCRSALFEDQRAQGRPGAGGTRKSVRDRNAHGVDHRCYRSPGLPCADGFNGVLRALLGERCTIAPVASRLIDARTRSGRRITARFDARTSGVGTTRLLRPRTAWPQRLGLSVRTPDHRPNRCDRAGSYRDAHDSRLPALSPPAAPALPRPPHPDPHLVTIAKRPFGRVGISDVCHKSEIRKM